MANRKEPVAWITVKGVRVPIFDGQSKEDAFKSFKERIGKRNSNQPTTQAEKKRVLKEYTNARNAAHNAKPDKQEKAGERFEKAKQKYSESKEKTAIKSVQVKGDREARTGVYNEQLKEVQDDIRQAESTPVRLRSGDYDKKLAELKQKEAELKGYIKRDSAGKKEQSQEQKIPSNPHERVESLAKRMENAKTEQEREAVRNDMDKAWKDIDHNKKLDDREKNHLESRLRDIYDKSKAQSNIKKNEDEKEKQIARNEAEKSKNSDSGFKTASEWDRESAPKITYDESKAKSYKITNGGLNRASQAAADTMGQSLFKNGRADIVIKEENARDTTYSLRDKYGNEVGTFLQARTEKKGTGKLTLYGVKTASKQKTNKK